MEPTGRMMFLREIDRVTEEYIRTLFLDAPNLETEERLALEIITGRFGGNYPAYAFAKPTPPEECAWTREQVAQLDKGELKEQATHIAEESARLNNEYVNELREWEAIQQCIAEKDPKLAYQLLHQRSNRKGEGLTILPIYGSYFVPKE